jgi:hypothetical protein
MSDISTLENSITSYKNETNKFPVPEGNLKYFKEDTSYAHDMTTAFWVSWYVTDKTIPAKYLNYLPLDPKTGQYYALSVTKDEKSYEIAWVTKKNETYMSAVNWNWKWESWPTNLIREYNWPNFVYDESLSNFPYNPEELLLTAKISNFSWSLSINWINYNQDETLAKTLVEWDKISVWTWAYAEIYFSDWSYSTLWDTDTDSEIVLSQMRYKEKTNLFTNIKLALNVWSLWTKASKLGEKSEYEIYTTDTIAAVRWTIFWVRKNWNSSNVSVIEWKVEVRKVTWIHTFEDLTKELKDDNLEKIWWESVWHITWITDDSWIIEVNSWENPKGLKITKDSIWTNNRNYIESASWTTNKLPDSVRDIIEKNIWEINSSIKLEILSLKNENWNKEIKIGLNDVLKNWNIVKINDNKYSEFLPTTNDYLVLSGSVLWYDNLNLSICKNENCSNKLNVDFKSWINYDKTELEKTSTWEEVKTNSWETNNYFNRWCFTSDDKNIKVFIWPWAQGEEGCYHNVSTKLLLYKPWEKVIYTDGLYWSWTIECFSSKQQIPDSECLYTAPCPTNHERKDWGCVPINILTQCPSWTILSWTTCIGIDTITNTWTTQSWITNEDIECNDSTQLIINWKCVDKVVCNAYEELNSAWTWCILKPKEFKLMAEANYYNDLNLKNYISNINIAWTGAFLNDIDSNQNNNKIYYKFDQTTSSFLNWDQTTTYNRRSTTLSGANYPDFVKRINDNFSIYEWGSYWKWIFIDNDNYWNWNDYLKYDINSLDLNSWSWFKIEMSVRGGALKRDGEYRLISLINNNSSLHINLNNSKLSLEYFNWSSSYPIVNLEKSEMWIINNDEFYKVILIKENNNFKLSVNWITKENSYNGIINNFSNIIIWSKYNFSTAIYNKQWNDIISNLMIYIK